MSFEDLEYDLLQSYCKVFGSKVEIIKRKKEKKSLYMSNTYHKNRYSEKKETRFLVLNEGLEYVEQVEPTNHNLKGFISGDELEKGTIVGDYEIDFSETKRKGSRVRVYTLIRRV